MPPAAPPHPSPQAAHAALVAWWTLAGVEVDPALADAGALLRQPGPETARPALSASSVSPAGLPVAPARAGSAPPSPADALGQARALAATATTLEALEALIGSFEGCALKRTARRTVILDGVRGADVLLVGAAPGREEDESGRPFVGRSGRLLDRMLASIGLSRSRNLCIANAVFWRPPGNRPPSRDELAVCAPFVTRLVELSAPKLLLFAGGAPAQTLLATATGILKLRGQRHSFAAPGLPGPIPAYVLLDPAYLLGNPAAKALVWKDLLTIEAESAALGLAGARPAGAPTSPSAPA